MRDTRLPNLNQIPFDEYLVRPQLAEGESLKGYVYRFYDDNGVNAPNSIWRLINQIYKQDNPDEKLVQQLQNIIRQTNVMAEYQCLKNYELLEYINTKNQRFLNAAQCRFCPKCVNENNKHWVLWDLPMFTVCLKHECQLMNCCSHCYRSFSWNAMGFSWHCICEANIKEMETYPATSLRLKVAQLIFNAEDGPLCSQYKKHNSVNQTNPYILKTLFGALEWAHFLKKKIRFVKKYPNKQHLIHLQKISKGSYGYWESRLLFQINPAQIVERVLKRLSVKNTTINTISLGLRFLTAIKIEIVFLEKNKNIFTESLTPLFKVFIKQYLIQIEKEVALWGNQSISNGAKQLSLNSFQDWWLLVVSESNHRPELEFQSEKLYRNRYSTRLCENILKKLVYASQFPQSYHIYQNHLKNWLFPSSVLFSPTSGYIMNELIIYLSKLGKHTLLRLYKVIEDADYQLRKTHND